MKAYSKIPKTMRLMKEKLSFSSKYDLQNVLLFLFFYEILMLFGDTYIYIYLLNFNSLVLLVVKIKNKCHCV